MERGLCCKQPGGAVPGAGQGGSGCARLCQLQGAALAAEAEDAREKSPVRHTVGMEGRAEGHAHGTGQGRYVRC